MRTDDHDNRVGSDGKFDRPSDRRVIAWGRADSEERPCSTCGRGIHYLKLIEGGLTNRPCGCEVPSPGATD